MANESLARAANSADLEMEPEIVRDADRVAAMASGNTLGSLLFRVGMGGQLQWGPRIINTLRVRACFKYPELGAQLGYRVAATALLEFVAPQCLVCCGARELVGASLRVTCHACEGTGKQRWSNNARRARIGAYNKLVDRAMATCHEEMSIALGRFLRATQDRLREHNEAEADENDGAPAANDERNA